MTLKVSLVIDGDASGAKKAAADTAAAYKVLGSEASAGLNTLRASADANVVSLTRVRDELGRASSAAAGKINSAAINSSLGVTSDFGAAARKTDIDAYGVSLDRLRAKFDPLFAAGQQYKTTLAEINNAARVGAIGENVRAEAIQRTKDSFTQQVTSIRTGASVTVAGTEAIAGSSRQARAEMINLSRQVQDVGVSLASGQSPFMVLTQQGSQIFDVFASSERSIGDFFKQAAAGAARFITPAALVTGAVLGIGAAIVTAASQYGSAQRDIELSLTGIGRASGVLRSDINSIGSNAASTFGLSASEARSFATALAATGKIGKDNIEPIVKLGHDTAIAFGTDAAGAAKLLATSFADPVKGATELNNRLGFLDAAMLRQITNLQAQNRLTEAQGLLQAGVARGLEGVNQHVATSANFWTALGNKISNTWDAFGRGASRFTGLGFTQGLDEQLDQTKQNIADLQKQLDGLKNRPALLTTGPQVLSRLPAGSSTAEVERLLDQQQQKLKQLEGEWQKYWDAVSGAQARRDSFAQRAAVDSVSPEIGQLDKLNNNYLNLSLTLEAVNRSGGAASPILAAMGITFEQLQKAIAAAKGELNGFKSSSDKAIEGLQLQIGAVGKRSPGALGELAKQQALLSLGSTSPQAQQQAELTGTLARHQAEQQIADAKAQSLLTSRQATDAANLELGIIGRSSVEQERQRGLLQAKQQLEQESLRNYGSRDAYDRGHLKALEDEINKQSQLKQQLAEQQTVRDLSFEQSQIGRSSDEQQVASKLRGIYGDNYASELDGSIAGQMRLNQSLQQTHDLGLSAYKGILGDLQQGKTLSEALGNSMLSTLSKVTDKLAEMAFNKLWQGALGPLGGGSGLLGGAGMGGGLLGGFIIPGILHDGGMAGQAPSSGRSLSVSTFASAPRFHDGKLPWDPSFEVPAIIRKEEEVGYPAQLAKKYGGQNTAQAAPANITISQQFYVTGHTGEELDARTKAAVSEATRNAVAYTDGSIRHFSDNVLPARIPDIQERML